jgi:ketosteroid isomerase-like protein
MDMMGMRVKRDAAVGGLLLLLVGLGACDGRAAEPRDDGAARAAEAEAAVMSFFEATNDGDSDHLLAHYHQGPELVQVACTEVRRGYDRVEPLIRRWLVDRPEVRLEYEVVRSAALGRDGAVVAAQGLNERGEALFWTYVLRRDADGVWRIVQEHQSWADCREPRLRRDH